MRSMARHAVLPSNKGEMSHATALTTDNERYPTNYTRVDGRHGCASAALQPGPSRTRPASHCAASAFAARECHDCVITSTVRIFFATKLANVMSLAIVHQPHVPLLAA